MNNTVPVGWKKGAFSDVVKLDYGKSPKDIFHENGKYPVIGTGGVTGFTNSYLHEGGTTVIGRKGTINNPSFISTKFWAIDTTYYVSEHKNADAKWFYYLIQNIDLTKFNEASGVPSLNRDTLYAIPCVSPSRPEQQKIATILTAVDDVIESTQAQINKLKALKTGMMQELLTKGIGHTEFKDSPVGRIPTTWKFGALSSICDLQVGYAFKSDWFLDEGIRLLRGDNVGFGAPTWERIKCLSEETAKNYPSYLLNENDIVIGMDRTFTKSGVKITKLSSLDIPCLLVQRVGKFTPVQCSSAFLWQLVRSNQFLDGLKSKEKGMDIPHLSKAEILEPLVAVPCLAEQNKIGEILSSMDDRIDAKTCKFGSLSLVKKALMQDLLTGKVRVQVN